VAGSKAPQFDLRRFSCFCASTVPFAIRQNRLRALALSLQKVV